LVSPSVTPALPRRSDVCTPPRSAGVLEQRPAQRHRCSPISLREHYPKQGNRMLRAKKHPKLSADERAFLNRLDRLNEEKIKQFTTREIFAYFKIIDKVDSRADVRQWWNARSE